MLHRIKTFKTPDQVIEIFREKASDHDFVIRNVFDMKEVFSSYGAETHENEEYYAVMVCNPPRAYQSIRKNPDRGAILLQPKQIFIYRQENDNYTTISYFGWEENMLAEAIPEDEDFQKNLPYSCQKIADLIKEVVSQ